MRTLALVILLATTALAFTIINNCGASQDYVNALDSYLQKAYDTYSKEIKTPALCPNFYVELRNDIQYPAVTYSQTGPLGVCAYKMEFRCDISLAWLQHLAFHEMAHALQNAIGDGGKGYGWWSEAHAEGLASYYMVVIYQAGQWQGYGWVQDFWNKQLYRQDPWQCVAPNLCAYQYGAFFAWLAWRYSPLNSTLTYGLPMDKLRMAYINFLLSPWSWGRDPVYNDFDACNAQMSPNSGLYCTYSPVLPNRVYVFSSSLFINATGLSDRILLALVTTKTATADPSVTVSYCSPTATVTTTQTVTRTETYTVTYTTTATYTTTVPVTYTTTVTVPTTTTVTKTETYTATVPITTTVTVPVTYTTTVTVPVTYTTTVTIPTTTTVTAPTTVTTTVTDTATKTETATVTVPITTTETVTTTTTVAEGGVSTTVLIIAVVVALLVGCYVCGRAAAKTDLKTQEL